MVKCYTMAGICYIIHTFLIYPGDIHKLSPGLDSMKTYQASSFVVRTRLIPAAKNSRPRVPKIINDFMS